MNWITKLLGGGASEAAGALGGLATDLREAIKGKELDPNKKLEMTSKLIQMQGEINKIEAAHRNIFVSGARPFIMWICGICLGMYYIPQFWVSASMWIDMCYLAGELLPYPTDITGLNQLVFALLGFGGLRTFEKTKGVAARS